MLVRESLFEFNRGGDPVEKLGLGDNKISIRYMDPDDYDIIDEINNITFPFVPHHSMQMANLSSNGIRTTIKVPKEIHDIVSHAADYALGYENKPKAKEIRQYNKWVQTEKGGFPFR